MFEELPEFPGQEKLSAEKNLKKNVRNSSEDFSDIPQKRKIKKQQLQNSESFNFYIKSLFIFYFLSRIRIYILKGIARISMFKDNMFVFGNQLADALSHLIDHTRRPTQRPNKLFLIKETDKVFIEIPTEVVKMGKLRVLVDTGADISIIKKSSLKTLENVYPGEIRGIGGVLGGHMKTLGTVEIPIGAVNKIQTKWHVMDDIEHIPADGIIGRDILWNRSIINTLDKTLEIFDGNKKVILRFWLKSLFKTKAGIKTVTTEKVKDEDILVPGRSKFIVELTVPVKSKPIIICSQEIEKGVYLANALVKPRNFKVCVPILNANGSSFKLSKNFQPQF